MVSGYDTFGFGGSDTTRALGLTEALKAQGKTLYDHWKTGLSREEDLEIRLQQGRCDCFSAVPMPSPQLVRSSTWTAWGTEPMP